MGVWCAIRDPGKLLGLLEDPILPCLLKVTQVCWYLDGLAVYLDPDRGCTACAQAGQVALTAHGLPYWAHAAGLIDIPVCEWSLAPQSG